MSIFNKLKQLAGIGGVKIGLTVPNEIHKNTQKFSGTIILTSKTEQHIKDISIELKERRLKKSGGTEQLIKEYILGSKEIAKNFNIKPGEGKTLEFDCPFTFDSYEPSRKHEEQLSTETGRKIGAFLDREKSVYTVTAAASVQGTVLASTAVETVQLVGNVSGSTGDMIEKA